MPSIIRARAQSGPAVQVRAPLEGDRAVAVGGASRPPRTVSSSAAQVGQSVRGAEVCSGTVRGRHDDGPLTGLAREPAAAEAVATMALRAHWKAWPIQPSRSKSRGRDRAAASPRQ
ncbi:hypothetical protein IV498_18355 [Paenarthrobacter sp. Z7-10]|uniref:hypothetical protein n=1 Tax=Paenarthrobacter sp. Z7-10 TaxID=2787635 RepID=UPI0022A8E06E|nr:hypothetical protein [Paenarthrobacter sp. Z7-10]MCZ2405062.1 hypothetical protein [Paenarthrobacter sp. Z7-10]